MKIYCEDRPMKLGINGDFSRIEHIKEWGFDYFEINFSILEAMTDGEFDDLCRRVRKSGIKAETACSLFPNDVQIYALEPEKLDSYLTKGCERFRKVGGEVLVFGSGKSRNVPETMCLKEAKERFVAILQKVADIAAEYGLSAVVEPLSFTATNFIHTAAEEMELITAADRKNLGGFIDFYHSYMNHEKLSDLDILKGKMIHAHIARSDPDRMCPTEADMKDCIAIAVKLKELGYNDRLTFEAGFKPDVPSMLPQIQNVLNLFRAL